MKLYQVVNDNFQPLPVKPFAKEADAVSHAKEVQNSFIEGHLETFYVIELNVTSTVQGS